MKKYLVVATALALVLCMLSFTNVFAADTSTSPSDSGTTSTSPAPTDTSTASTSPNPTATPAASSAYVEPNYYADYAEADENLYVVVCRRLNVRSTPSTKLSAIGQLQRGDVVKVVSIENGWARIEMSNGSNAYVYAKYIEKQ